MDSTKSSFSAIASGKLGSMVFRGDGEPCRTIGPSYNGERRKVDLAMGTATSDIRAIECTPSGEGDSPVLPDLLGQILGNEDVGTVTAGGAYDTRRCHGAVIARGGTAIILIRTNGRAWKEDCPAAKARNETSALRVTTVRHSGSSGPDTTPAAA